MRRSLPQPRLRGRGAELAEVAALMAVLGACRTSPADRSPEAPSTPEPAALVRAIEHTLGEDFYADMVAGRGPLLRAACREGDRVACLLGDGARPETWDGFDALDLAGACFGQGDARACWLESLRLGDEVPGRPVRGRDPAAAIDAARHGCEALGSALACARWAKAQPNPKDPEARAARQAVYDDACRRGVPSACRRAAAYRYSVLLEAFHPKPPFNDGSAPDPDTVAKVWDEGRGLAREGCRLGSENACEYLGLFLDKKWSPDLPGQPEEAVAAWERACSSGLPVACYDLASALSKGRGAPRDLPRAARLFSDACDRGFGFACPHAGDAFRDGLGVAADLDRARAFYRTACGQKDDAGCIALMLTYEPEAPLAGPDAEVVAAWRTRCTGPFCLDAQPVTPTAPGTMLPRCDADEVAARVGSSYSQCLDPLGGTACTPGQTGALKVRWLVAHRPWPLFPARVLRDTLGDADVSACIVSVVADKGQPSVGGCVAEWTLPGCPAD